jgi:glycosyltransferase involved in cell wall biosynthesis
VSNNVRVEIVIYGGYRSKNETKDWKIKGSCNGINYVYLSKILVQSPIMNRLFYYLGDIYYRIILNLFLERNLFDANSVFWLDTTIPCFELLSKIKKKCVNKTFIEVNEYMDNYLNNKTNFIQRYTLARRKRIFEQSAIVNLDGLALMTKTLFDYYKLMPTHNFKLIHLPMTVDISRFDVNIELSNKFKAPYIVYVGVMNNSKDGLDVLLEAYHMVQNYYNDIKLYLVGGWNYDTPEHLEFIKRNRLEKKVFWLNEVPRNEVPGIIKNAELLVLPRPDSKQAQGGFPTKLGEYLATGNPVCATKVGELPDYLVDNESVFFAEPGDANSFANAIIRALSNPENAKRVGLNGRKVAEEHFNKDVQAKRLLQFLNSL